MSQKVSITSPVGRIVAGSLYKPNATDAEGKPLVIKTGPNAGQPRVNYFFALAIPKGPEPHWAHTPWGAQIWQVGHAAFPNIASSPSFAWKIEDGDSIVPNKKGRKPCDNEGWKGHWIIKLSGGFAPKIYEQQPGGGAFVEKTQPDFIKGGYYVEVAFNVEGNGSPNQPGVYLNHSMVCFRGYGTEISFGPNVNDAGFGQAALPAGASATPIGGGMPPMPAVAGTPVPGLPPAPNGYAPAVGATPAPGGTAYAPPAITAPPANVVPNTGFLTPPIPGAAPVAAPPPVPQAAPVARVMTPAAGNVPYEAYIQKGWTDAQLVQHGYMVP